MSPTSQASRLPRVDIERDNGRVVAIYLDQFLIRGVRAVSFEDAFGSPPLLKLEILVDDVVVRDSGDGKPPTTMIGSLAASVAEGGLLISGDRSPGHVQVCSSCGMRAHGGECT